MQPCFQVLHRGAQAFIATKSQLPPHKELGNNGAIWEGSELFNGEEDVGVRNLVVFARYY
jgi:hypothetical protein